MPGDKGLTGPSGKDGEPGPTGNQGPKGDHGKDGAAGKSYRNIIQLLYNDSDYKKKLVLIHTSSLYFVLLDCIYILL